jgi:hypothetical protein
LLARNVSYWLAAVTLEGQRGELREGGASSRQHETSSEGAAVLTGSLEVVRFRLVAAAERSNSKNCYSNKWPKQRGTEKIARVKDICV